MNAHARRRRRDLRTAWLYARALAREFRGSLIALAAAVLAGGLLYRHSAQPVGGLPPSPAYSFYVAWMALLGQTVISPAEPSHLDLVFGLLPLAGFVIVGEGVVRLSLLVLSRRHAEKEWMRVEASTYRDHIVLCGLGHLGFRVLQQFVAGGVPVVAIEKNAGARFLGPAKATRTPILIRDMTDDQALIDAGVPHARAIVIASNDDLANLEVALDARRMNPKIRIAMRLFDQQIASKIAAPLAVDVAFSSSALAAPTVAAMALGAKVLASFPVAGVAHVTAEVTVETGGPLAGRTLVAIEQAHGVRVLAHLTAGGGAIPSPAPGTAVAPGDVLTVHAPASRLPALTAGSRLL